MLSQPLKPALLDLDWPRSCETWIFFAAGYPCVEIDEPLLLFFSYGNFKVTALIGNNFLSNAMVFAQQVRARFRQRTYMYVHGVVGGFLDIIDSR